MLRLHLERNERKLLKGMMRMVEVGREARERRGRKERRREKRRRNRQKLYDFLFDLDLIKTVIIVDCSLH